MQKHSKKRDAILNCICSTKTHPSAEWVYARLKPDIPDLSLATVYRNISLFKDQGKVVTVATVNGHERIDGDTSPHPHFICSKCSSVIDIEPLNGEKALETDILEKYGFEVNSHELLFRGCCNKCKALETN